MMSFATIYLEKDIEFHPRVLKILQGLGNPTYVVIHNYSDIWGRVNKPYLQKRDKLNLFLAQKKGQKVKPAPEAYGVMGEPHYYFIHAYNCIYECQYCYLQGYFNTPDLVWFINHEEIVSEMQSILNLDLITQAGRVWFHAGEFSDSLALSHITHDFDCYYEFLQRNPRACLELRTKSVNLKELKRFAPLPNLITSFSMSSQVATQTLDLKTPNLNTRLKALSELQDLGYKVAIHLDPIVYHPEFEQQYQELIELLESFRVLDALEYISLGVVRFTKEVYSQVRKNYPDSSLLDQPFIKPQDGKIRYPLYMRKMILTKVQEMFLQKRVLPEKIYYCMENSFHLET